mgnify:CR=1 FL=1
MQGLSYRTHQELDYDAWDACVESTPHPQPYGFSWYLNWVAPNWGAVVYGNYEAVLPVFPQEKWRVSFSTRPFGTQQLGPFAKVPLSAELLAAMVDLAMQHVTYGEFFISHNTPLPLDWTPQQLTNLELHLDAQAVPVASLYSKQIKRNLKKAAQSEAEWAQWTTLEEAVQLWQRTVQEKTNIHDAHLERLQRLMEFCHYQGRGQLLSLTDSTNSLVAAQFWILYQGRATLLLNAASSWAKSQGLPTLLIDRAIDLWSGRVAVFDFEGSSIPGLHRFYSGFGAQDRPYYLHIDNRLPAVLRWLKPASTLKK